MGEHHWGMQGSITRKCGGSPGDAGAPANRYRSCAGAGGAACVCFCVCVYVRVFLCVCVVCVPPVPSPVRPARKGWEISLPPGRLKPRCPAVASWPRAEGGWRHPRCAAGSGRRGGRRRRRPRGAGQCWAAAAGGGGLSLGWMAGSAGCPGRRALSHPGLFRILPSASHCSKFARRWAAELVAIAELGREGGREGKEGRGVVCVKL